MAQTVTSFRPGQSGNPSGRPVGSSRLQICMLRMLDQAVELHAATYDVQFATGLTIVTATASGDLTVSFK
jgi:hypothetical protein